MSSVCNLIKQAGCVKERDAKSVQSKIKWLESCFRRATDWANSTREGVKKTDGNTTFEKEVSAIMFYQQEKLKTHYILSSLSAGAPITTICCLSCRTDPLLGLSLHLMNH